MARTEEIFRALTVMLVISLAMVEANPIGVCIRNCAQCKKMFGPYFDGQMCADACVKFSGKFIPDSQDIASIAPFLIKLNLKNLRDDDDG